LFPKIFQRCPNHAQFFRLIFGGDSAVEKLLRFVEIRCKSFCRPVQPFPPKTTGRKIMQDAQTQINPRNRQSHAYVN
jgi:hypothetical protein